MEREETGKKVPSQDALEGLVPSELPQQTVIGSFIASTQAYVDGLRNLRIDVEKAGKEPRGEIREELEGLQGTEATLRFAVALEADLTGTGPILDFWEEGEERDAYRTVLLSPTVATQDNTEKSDDDQLGFTVFMMGLEMKAEMHPEMVRQFWTEDVSPLLEGGDVSLEEIAESTGVNLDLLQDYKNRKRNSMNMSDFRKIGEYIFDKTH